MVHGLTGTQPLPSVKLGTSVLAVVARNVVLTRIPQREPTAVATVLAGLIQQRVLAAVRHVRQRVNTGTGLAVQAVRRDTNVPVTVAARNVRQVRMQRPGLVLVLIVVRTNTPQREPVLVRRVLLGMDLGTIQQPGQAAVPSVPRVNTGTGQPVPTVARTNTPRREPTAVATVLAVLIQQPVLAAVRRVRQRVNTGTGLAVQAVRRGITVLVMEIGIHVRLDLLLVPVRLVVLVTVVPVTGII